MIMAGIKEIGGSKYNLELPEVRHKGKSGEFKKYLKEYLDGVNRLQKEADRAAEDLITGRSENIHQAMIAMEKAELSFRLMVEARNRIVRAYEEIMKTQV